MINYPLTLKKAPIKGAPKEGNGINSM